MMLYQVREAQRAFMNPISGWAGMMSKLYSNRHSPFSYLPMAARVAAGFELLHRLGKEYEKPRFDITDVKVDGLTLPVSETVEQTRPFCRLLKFKRQVPGGGQGGEPVVLIVAPLSGHHSTLLRDTVRTMVQHHEVYITDWIDARMVPLSEGDFHLHDYVAYVIGFLRHLGPRAHVVSVCQPTVPVMGAVSIMSTKQDPDRPLSMTMMGGPIDPRQSPTQVNELALDKPYSWFEQTVIHRVPGKYPGAGRLVYPGFLQHAGFVSMNPDRHAQSHWDFYLHLLRGDLEDAQSHRKFYDEYNAVLDLPAKFYLDTIKLVFQDFALPTGNWVVPFEGEQMRVKPADIRDVALLTVEGELDDISGPGQTRAAHGLCTGLPAARRKDFIVKGAGHYGIFSGRRWREQVYPIIRAFIAQAEIQPMRDVPGESAVKPTLANKRAIEDVLNSLNSGPATLGHAPHKAPSAEASATVDAASSAGAAESPPRSAVISQSRTTTTKATAAGPGKELTAAVKKSATEGSASDRSASGRSASDGSAPDRSAPNGSASLRFTSGRTASQGTASGAIKTNDSASTADVSDSRAASKLQGNVGSSGNPAMISTAQQVTVAPQGNNAPQLRNAKAAGRAAASPAGTSVKKQAFPSSGR